MAHTPGEMPIKKELQRQLDEFQKNAINIVFIPLEMVHIAPGIVVLKSFIINISSRLWISIDYPRQLFLKQAET